MSCTNGPSAFSGGGAAAADRLPVGAGQVRVRPGAAARTAASSSIIAGEIVLQMPPEDKATAPSHGPRRWRAATRTAASRRFADLHRPTMTTSPRSRLHGSGTGRSTRRTMRTQAAERAATKRKESAQMAKVFGLPGLDDESNRAFAAKLMKYAGWRSVRYRGQGRVRRRLSFRGPRDAGLRLPDACPTTTSSSRSSPSAAGPTARCWSPRRRSPAASGPFGARAKVLRPAGQEATARSRAPRAASPSSPTAKS